MRLAIPLSGLILLIVAGSGAAGRPEDRAAADFRYVDTSAATDPRLSLVDTRPESSCRAATVSGAICLPTEAFFGPHRRLASVRDISWVLGSAGLSGDEPVLVLGTDPVRRDAVAALLYLAGQDQVSVLNAPMDVLLRDGDSEPAPGRARGILRDPIHAGPWREQLILLRDELADAIDGERIVRLLDGRPLDEYWGERIRARRGGHLPGAESAPAHTLRAALSGGDGGLWSETPVVAYAQDPLAGLAYFTLLRAGLGLDATLYPGGWREWADDGRLPADAISYAQTDTPGYRGSEPAPEGDRPAEPGSAFTQSLLTLAAVVSAGGFGYLLGRRTA